MVQQRAAMPSGIDATDSAPVAVFGLRAWRFLCVFSFCLTAWLRYRVRNHAWQHDAVAALLPGLEVLLVLLELYSFSGLQLVVSRDGVQYRAWGSTLFAAWEDIAGWGTPRGWQYAGSEGVFVRHPRWQHPRWKVWAGQERAGYIPLYHWYGPYWQQGVGERMYQYAPWVLDTLYRDGGL